MYSYEQKKQYFSSLTPENKDWYLYHSYKNREWLPTVVIISIICLIFGAKGIIFDLVLWGIYGYYCLQNNWELNNDPIILYRRADSMRRFFEKNNRSENK